MIRIEDIVFWILILTSVAILLWLLRGSPTLENTVITVGLFILGSELMLWRKYFEVDKNTAINLTNNLNLFSSIHLNFCKGNRKFIFNKISSS